MHSVLIIDSEKSSANRLVSALDRAGFEVRVASSEVEGISQAGDGFPDVILVKDRPPKIDGLVACRELRHRYNLPLILMGDREIKDVCPERLAEPVDWDYYMNTPISTIELVARIKALLWRYGKIERPGLAS